MKTNHALSKSWILFSLLFYLFTSFNKRGQDKPWICEQSKFTYQLVLHQRGNVQLPTTICETLEKERKQSERVYYKYSDYLTIVIFSVEEMKNPNTQLPEITYDAH
jgi:hypothetical protein